MSYLTGMTKRNSSTWDILKEKNVKSPQAKEMYAIATSINGRTQKWLADKESLTRFLKSVPKGEFNVVYVNKSEMVHDEPDTDVLS